MKCFWLFLLLNILSGSLADDEQNQETAITPELGNSIGNVQLNSIQNLAAAIKQKFIQIDFAHLKNLTIPIIWILGGPGSGKGTQSILLSLKYGFIHISTGRILRKEITSGSALGQQIVEIIKKGDLVPDQIVLELLQEEMLKQIKNEPKGFLIDGYPRDIEQAQDFEAKIKSPSLLLYYNCSDEIMTRRILVRSKNSGRSDDNDETIKERLEIFHQETEPVLDYYKLKVARIDANNNDAYEIFVDSCYEINKMLLQGS